MLLNIIYFITEEISPRGERKLLGREFSEGDFSYGEIFLGENFLGRIVPEENFSMDYARGGEEIGGNFP